MQHLSPSCLGLSPSCSVPARPTYCGVRQRRLLSHGAAHASVVEVAVRPSPQILTPTRGGGRGLREEEEEDAEGRHSAASQTTNTSTDTRNPAAWAASAQLSADHRPSTPLPPPSEPSTSEHAGPDAHAAASALPWGALVLLFVCYLQQSWTQFSLPIMLPAITADLQLTDVQGGSLTTGYTYLYALALPPAGMLADRMRRPNLLAAGVASWSGLTLLATMARGYWELLAARVGFAAAQAVQNPISFALIAELFPNNKSAALALYNTSLYFGRALSFGSALAAEELTKMRVGEAVMDAATTSHGAAWRDVLRCTALPGFLIAGALMLALPEPKDAAAAAASPVAGTSAGDTRPGEAGVAAAASSSGRAAAVSATAAKDSQVLPVSTDADLDPLSGVSMLLRSPAFMTTTIASAFNDFCSYSLLSWLSTFYERVHHLDASQYAPVMAVVLPVGGIIGGVGGGWVADRVAAGKMPGIGRGAITAGTNALAAPLMALAFLAGGPNQSFWALMGGYAMSEAWRAPSGNMARSCAPASMSATAVSLYLAIRCTVGGLGPLAVALLTEHMDGDIQKGMMLVPLSYLVSGALFLAAEKAFEEEGASRGLDGADGAGKEAGGLLTGRS